MKKLKKTIIISVGILLSIIPINLIAVTLSGISVSPTAVNAGQYVTLKFTINSGSATSYYVVAISPFSTFDCSAFNASNPTQYNIFVVNNDGVYDSSMSIPDYIGPNSGDTSAGYGISINTNGNNQELTYVFKIPPDAPSTTVYAHVVAHDWSLNAYPTSCDTGNVILDSYGFYVTAVDDCIRLDLEMFNPTGASTTASQIQLGARITNHGIWPVAINGLKVRWWFTDSGTSFGGTIPDNNQELFAADNRSYLGQVGSIAQVQGNLTFTANCSNSRNAYYYIEAQISGSVGQVIPGGGGYMSTHSNETDAFIRFHVTNPSWKNFDSYDDDYSRFKDFGFGFNNHNSSKYVTLYDYNGNLLWEYTDYNTLDPSTGEEPCDVQPDYIACGIPINVSLHKSIDKTEVVIGDTITYCITYTNEGSNTVTSFHIWDTIPDVTTFIGCDNSCTTQNIGGRTIVSWTISTIYPGDSGTVCFWVQVTSYPYYKFLEDKFFAVLDRFTLWDKRKKLKAINLRGKRNQIYFITEVH